MFRLGAALIFGGGTMGSEYFAGYTTDRRATLLSTSPTGLEVQRRIGQAGAAALDDILSSWSEKDRNALGSLMVRFADQLARHRSLDPDDHTHSTRHTDSTDNTDKENDRARR